MSDHLVELGLNQPSSSTALAHLERMLDVLGDALTSPEDGAERTTLLACIEAYRAALAHGNHARVREAGDALLAACYAALDRNKKLRASMRNEIADLVTLFREVTASVAGEGAAFSADMNESAARFSALGHISDIRLLKERLTREVTRLKEVAQTREQRWRSVVSSFQDKVETLEEQLLATQQEASIDPLTAVANRRTFDRTLKTFMTGSVRNFSLVIIDIDDFKDINDTQGHEGGDRVLQAIAHTFATSVRSDDMVARLGGDEFALILENVTLLQATARVTSIVGKLPGATPQSKGPLTVSCGVAEFSTGDTPQSLMKRADEALYEAKRQGKGRVVPKAAMLIRDLRAGRH